MEKEALKSLGLAENEIKVYLTLLKLGSSLASKIAEDIGLHRTNVYDLLEKLKSKGLVSYVIKNNRRYFKAVEPKQLLKIAEDRKRLIQDIVPVLENLSKFSRDEVDVEIFKGEAGLRNIFNDILRYKEFLAWGVKGQLVRFFPYFGKQSVRRIIEKKIKKKLLCEYGVKLYRVKKDEYRTLPKSYVSQATTVIYSDKIAIIVWASPSIGILIKNKNIAKNYKANFMIMWEIAKIP